MNILKQRRTGQACSTFVGHAGSILLAKENCTCQGVKSRYLETKTYVIDDEYLASLRDKKKLPSSASKRSRRFDGGLVLGFLSALRWGHCECVLGHFGPLKSPSGHFVFSDSKLMFCVLELWFL